MKHLIAFPKATLLGISKWRGGSDKLLARLITWPSTSHSGRPLVIIKQAG
jgi:hypothetical protein